MSDDAESAAAIAEANHLVQAVHVKIATASPSRLAAITRELRALAGETHARDMTPAEYAKAKAELTRGRR
jgi:ribosomal protein S11